MRNLKIFKNIINHSSIMFYINYEEFKARRYNNNCICLCMFYINYEEFKDRCKVNNNTNVFSFILTMRNLKIGYRNQSVCSDCVLY